MYCEKNSQEHIRIKMQQFPFMKITLKNVVFEMVASWLGLNDLRHCIGLDDYLHSVSHKPSLRDTSLEQRRAYVTQQHTLSLLFVYASRPI